MVKWQKWRAAVETLTKTRKRNARRHLRIPPGSGRNMDKRIETEKGRCQTPAVWAVIGSGFSGLNAWAGLAGSLVAVRDHFKSRSQELPDAPRKKPAEAYMRCCEYQKHRQDDLGIPNREEAAGDWERCRSRAVFPSADDMAALKIAGRGASAGSN